MKFIQKRITFGLGAARELELFVGGDFLLAIFSSFFLAAIAGVSAREASSLDMSNRRDSKIDTQLPIHPGSGDEDLR